MSKFITKINAVGMEIEEKPKYNHGYSFAEVENIEKNFQIIFNRDKIASPVTLKETEMVIVPYLKIKRTEAFNLNVVKEKPIKPPKPPTKTFIKKKLKELAGQEEGLSPEDQEFIKTYGEQK